MTSFKQEIALLCILLIGLCNAQHQHQPGHGPSDKQIRLEDIERDNLDSQAQKEQVGPPVSHNNFHPAQSAHQQQIAAYQQQQYYLQQLQHQQQQVAQQQVAHTHPAAIQGGAPHQVIVPQPVPYNTLPVMILHQQPIVDPLAQYYLQQQLAALQYQPVTHAVQAIPHQALAHPALIPQAIPQQVVQIIPQQQVSQQQAQPQAQRVQANNNKPFRPSPPLAPAQQRPPTQTLVYTQQHYNPYNTIYQQQQQQKFLTGVKSTPAPPLKESQSPVATQYATFKSF